MTDKQDQYADDFLGADDRSKVLANLALQNPRERVRQALENVSEKAKCPDCGSEWFFEVNLNQYSATAYSATTGGDLQVLSLQSQSIKICPCGRPFLPNLGGASVGTRTHQEDVASMRNSVRGAIEARDARKLLQGMNPEQVKAQVSETVGQIIEQTATADEVKSLETKLQGLDSRIAKLSGAEARLEGLVEIVGELQSKVDGSPAQRKGRG